MNHHFPLTNHQLTSWLTIIDHSHPLTITTNQPQPLFVTCRASATQRSAADVFSGRFASRMLRATWQLDHHHQQQHPLVVPQAQVVQMGYPSPSPHACSFYPAILGWSASSILCFPCHNSYPLWPSCIDSHVILSAAYWPPSDSCYWMSPVLLVLAV